MMIGMGKTWQALSFHAPILAAAKAKRPRRLGEDTFIGQELFKMAASALPLSLLTSDDPERCFRRPFS